MECGYDAARLRVELVLALVVSYRVNDAARHILHRDVTVCRELASANSETCGDERLASDFALLVLDNERIKNGV